MDKEFEQLLINNKNRILFGLAALVANEEERLNILENDKEFHDTYNIDEAKDEIQILNKLMESINLNLKEYMQPIPEVGKTYHFFDDGKLKPSRHHYVIIDQVYDAKDTPGYIEESIIEAREEDHKYKLDLYADTTDFIVRGHFKDDPDEVQWFIRTTDGGWYSLDGWYSGVLDVDNSLIELACKESGISMKKFLKYC